MHQQPTSKWLTFMYSQTRFVASAWSISLPPVPKNLASASDMITEDGPDSIPSVVDSASGLNRLEDSSVDIYNEEMT